LIRLSVFNAIGQEVAVLVNEEKQPGLYKAVFDTASLPSGIYFYKLHVSNTSTGSGQTFLETRKMVL
jgi:hypothetical protein